MNFPRSIRATRRYGLCLTLVLVLVPVYAAAQTPAAAPPAAAAVAHTASAPAAKPDTEHDAAKADAAYLDGARQLEHKNLAGAEADFARAVALNPKREEYLLALELTREHHITDLVQQAAEARQHGETAHSSLLLAEARKLDPSNEIVAQHNPSSAPLPAGIRIEGTGSPDAAASDAATRKIFAEPIAHIAGPIELVPMPGDQQFDLRGDVREIVRKIATGFGIQVSFDDSVGAQQLHFALDSAPYTQVMPIVLRMAHLFAVPLDAHRVLVAKDTTENRQKFEHQLEETIYVPGTTNEQMNELGNIVKNVFDIKQVTVQTGANSMVIRAPEPALKAVNYVLADLVDGGAQVMLDIRLYEIDRTNTRNVGIAPPQSVGVYSVAAQAESIVASNQTAINQAISQNLITLKTGPDSAFANLVIEAAFLVESGLVTNSVFSSVFGVTGMGAGLVGYSAGSSTFNLGLNSSDTRELDDIQVRVGDRQDATFKVGSKYPIQTSTYSSGGSSSCTSTATYNGQSICSLIAQYTGSGSSTASVSVPQVQYEDIGLTLKATPTVQRAGTVSIHVDMKIESLTGQTSLGNPILSSRLLTSDVSVEDGTPAVLTSLVSKTESAALTGLPGLSELPGFQNITEDMVETDRTEVLITITPHVVRRRANALYSARIVFNRRAGAEDQ